jgi:hypothetical protein
LPAPLGEYNRQQLEALRMVRTYLEERGPSGLRHLKGWVRPYLRFRKEVSDFQQTHFSDTCTRKCFTSRASACCSREGMATFFADMVINGMLSFQKQMDALEEALLRDRGGPKCVYLASHGCLWRLKPIVCEMFLCKHAMESVLTPHPALRARWEGLRRRERRYTWPSRPLLFDRIEAHFIEAGYESPLMYLHKSPGLIRVKQKSRKSRNGKNPVPASLDAPHDPPSPGFTGIETRTSPRKSPGE